MTGIVYLLTNTANGKAYVGATGQSLARRWRLHCEAARYGKQTPLHEAIRKYGPEAFTLEILAHTSSVADRESMEVIWIFLMNSMQPDGYNARDGGKRGQFSAQSRRRMGAATSRRCADPIYRKKLSDAAKRRHSRNHHP